MSEEQKDKINLQYWEFMLNGDSWDLSSDGLLNIIVDSFYEI